MKFFDTLFDMLGLPPRAQPSKPAPKARRANANRTLAQSGTQAVTATLEAKPARKPNARTQAFVTQENSTAQQPAPVNIQLDTQPKTTKPARETTRAKTKADLYEKMTREMLGRYDIRVRKWRSSMSGCAWYVTYRDGSVQRLLESPKPKSPMSAAIFLHEIGHHAIGFNVYKPRCLEEYHAWQYSLAQMRVWNIPITPRVMTRYQRSMKYAVGKATRRGIKALPSELLGFMNS
jgi:hypothetical protein